MIGIFGHLYKCHKLQIFQGWIHVQTMRLSISFGSSYSQNCCKHTEAAGKVGLDRFSISAFCEL